MRSAQRGSTLLPTARSSTASPLCPPESPSLSLLSLDTPAAPCLPRLNTVLQCAAQAFLTSHPTHPPLHNTQRRCRRAGGRCARQRGAPALCPATTSRRRPPASASRPRACGRCQCRRGRRATCRRCPRAQSRAATRPRTRWRRRRGTWATSRARTCASTPRCCRRRASRAPLSCACPTATPTPTPLPSRRTLAS